MLYILKYQHLFDFIDLDNTVYFFLVVVFEGVEVGSEEDFVEEEIYLEWGKGLLLDLWLEERLYERPEDYLVNYAIYCACFLLILEETHLTSVHSQTQVSCIDHSDPAKIIGV